MVATGVFRENFSLLRLPSKPDSERKPPLTRLNEAWSPSG